MKRRIVDHAPLNGDVRHYDVGGLLLSEEHASPRKLIVLDESLVDSKRLEYNPCMHVKNIRTVQVDSNQYFARKGSGTVLDGSVEVDPPILLDQCIDALGKDTLVLTYAEELFRRAHAQEVDSRFQNLKFESTDPNFSLVVFIAELKEVKKTIPGLRKHFSTLKRAIKRSDGRAKTVGDLISGLWLDWSYGTGAFVRDLVKLWQLFSNMNGKYADFISGMGKVKSTGHFVQLQLPPPLPHPPITRRIYGADFTFSEVWHVYHVPRHEPYSNLSVNYKYFSEGMTGLFGKSKFVAQNLGVVFDPSIPWDLVPLSFVLDWLIPVGEFLHRHRIDLYDITLRMLGAGFGSRVTIQRNLFVEFLNTNLTGSLPGVMVKRPLGTSLARLYRRVPVTPEKVPKSLQLGGLTLNKALSGAALTWVISGSKKKRSR